MKKEFGIIKEEFCDGTGHYCAFTDKGILIGKSKGYGYFLPYEGIKKIHTFLWFSIEGYGVNPPTTLYYSNKFIKKKIKELVKIFKKNKNIYQKTSLYYETKFSDTTYNNVYKKQEIEHPHVEKTSSNIIAIILIALFLAIICFVIFGNSSNKNNEDKGHWGDDGYYNPTDQEMQDAWDDANDWMKENW